MIRNTSGHRQSNPQRLMNPSKAVVHEVDCHHEGVVLKFLAESVGQTREPTHGHPQGEVLPFNGQRRPDSK